MANVGWKRWENKHEKLDPYSRWLLVSGKNSFDFSRLFGDQEIEWFLYFLRGKKKKSKFKVGGTGTKADDLREVIWAPDENYAFALRQKHFEDVQESPFLSFGAGAPERSDLPKGGSASAGTLSESEPLIFSQLEEAYIQFAPMDKEMVPREFVSVPPPADIDGICVDQKNAVIVGVIDDGINVAHERFLDPHQRSRVDFFWHQDGLAEQKSHVMFGREFSGTQVTEFVRKFGTEEDVLRALGLVDPAKADASTLSKSFSHGTFVLDRLAGYSSDERRYAPSSDGQSRRPNENEGTRPEDRRIVAVQLHRRITEESSGALYTLFAMLALEYIVDRARVLARAIRNRPGGEKPPRKIPLVVNFSYGVAGGPHNGDHLFERFVDQMISRLDEDQHLGPLIIPMPAGNRHLLKGHANRRAAKTEQVSLNLNWITQPRDKSPNYLEIWVPRPPAAHSDHPENTPSANILEFALKAQFAGTEFELKYNFDLSKSGQNQSWALIKVGDTEPVEILAQVTLDTLDADNVDESKRDKTEPAQFAKSRILIALAPTEPVSDGKAHLPAGVWSIKVKTQIEAGKYIEAWVQRDDSPPLFRRPGRQSYLELRDWSPEWQRLDELTEYVNPIPPDAGLSRYGAISGLATAQNMLRVSGTRLFDDNLPALYSGAIHEGMRPVQAAAPADRSRVFRGLIGTGGRSGSTQVMNGTSVAAPIVGRMVADFLVKYTPTDAEDAVKNFLCQKHRGNDPKNPNPAPAKVVLKDKPDLARRRGGHPLRIGDPQDEYENKQENNRKWPFFRR